MLFKDIIIGPIHSRRLGSSLGVNLLFPEAKVCTFNCIYCECGFNFTNQKSKMPTRQQVKEALHKRLIELKQNNQHIDVITFAGNGEPTMHPEFEHIIDDTIALRNTYFPEAKVSVLSNATMIQKPQVFAALNKVDNNILKLDSAIEQTVKIINQPFQQYSLPDTIKQLAKFNGNVVIQTLFFSGEYMGQKFDNTTDKEVNAWLEALKQIKPREVMLYSLDRATPAKNLVKVHNDHLKLIAQKVEALGIPTLVTE